MPSLLRDRYPDFALILIGLTLSLWSWLDLRLAKAARAWPTTTGHVLGRSIDSTDAVGRHSYLPIIRYKYAVEGATYRGTRLSFRHYWSRQRAIIAAYYYSPGDTVTVHYDPAVPDRSVLKPEADDRPWVRLGIGLLILGVGVGAFILAAAAV
jgi:hypothetical protein